MAAVAEFLHRINNVLVIGSFELDYDTQEIRLRTAADRSMSPLDAAALRHLIVTNRATMDPYLPALEAVADGTKTPLEALAELGAAE